MAACCAIGALVIYHLMAIHSRLPSFHSSKPATNTTPSELDLFTSSPIGSSKGLESNIRERRTCRLFLQGLTCQSCVTAVEQALTSTPGVQNASVSLQSLSACITYNLPCVQPDKLVAAVEEAGFDVTAQTHEEDWRSQWVIAAALKEDSIQELKQRFHASAIVSAVVFALETFDAWYMPRHAFLPLRLSMLTLVIAATSIALLAAPLHREAYSALSTRRATSSLLSSAGLLSVMVAALHHQISKDHAASENSTESFSVTSACMLLTVILGGRITKSLVSQRSTQFVTHLASVVPEQSQLYNNTNEGPQSNTIPTSLLCPGDKIVVGSGAPFPADCTITSGRTSILETIVKGETSPTSIGPGDTVLAGCTNCGGEVIAEVARVGKETWLGQTLRAVAQASETKFGLQHSSDRLLGLFAVFVLAFSCCLGAFYMYMGAALEETLNRVATVLLCACPCTLGLGIPICLMTASANAHTARILLRPGTQLEKAAKAKAIVFDKTGTLTYGTLHIQHEGIEPEWEANANSVRQKMLWQMIRDLTRISQHPVSLLLHRLSTEKCKEFDNDEAVEEAGIVCREDHPGLGHAATFTHCHEKFQVSIGNIRMMQMQGVYLDPTQTTRSANETPLGTVYISINGRLACTMKYSDKIVPESASLIQYLHSCGLQTYMMTGDTEISAQATAKQIGIPPSHVHASLLPHEKAALIEHLERKVGSVIMVGDNLNDAAALTASSFGFVVSHSTEDQHTTNTTSGTNNSSSLLPSLHADADALILSSRTTSMNRKSASNAEVPELSGLHRIPYVLDLAHETTTRMQNALNWSLAYNVIALGLASGVVRVLFRGSVLEWIDFSPTSASLAMSLNSIAVLFYSLGLQNWRPTWLSSDHASLNVGSVEYANK